MEFYCAISLTFPFPHIYRMLLLPHVSAFSTCIFSSLSSSISFSLLPLLSCFHPNASPISRHSRLPRLLSFFSHFFHFFLRTIAIRRNETGRQAAKFFFQFSIKNHWECLIEYKNLFPNVIVGRELQVMLFLITGGYSHGNTQVVLSSTQVVLSSP